MASEYFGRGPAAEAVACLVSEDVRAREAGRADDRDAREALDAADAAIGAVVDDALGRFAGWMAARGYRRHRRGEWRRAKGASMSVPATTTAEAEIATAQDAGPPPAPIQRRVFGRRGEVAALHAVAYRLGGDGDEWEKSFQRLRKDAEALAEELSGGPGAPAIVQALANAAAVAWGEWTILTMCDHGTKGRTLVQSDHASRIADRAHRRYMRTLRALSDLRRAEVRIVGGRHNIQINGGPPP